MAQYEFAIKKSVLKGGKATYIPLVREKSKWDRFSIFNKKWLIIVRIYDVFMLFDEGFYEMVHPMLKDYSPQLTSKECEEHIEGYCKFIAELEQNQVSHVEYHELETKEL